MASVASELMEEVTAHAQSDSLEDARAICADGTYFPNNLRRSLTRKRCFAGMRNVLSCENIRECWALVLNFKSALILDSTGELNIAVQVVCK